MNGFFDFNQRVYLRRDPSHYGRIRRGSWLADAVGSDSCQFVQWEQDGASHTTHENVADLMSEAEYRERRRLFAAAMRHPEMRLLRKALLHLHIDKALDWRTIDTIQMDRYGSYNDCWMMNTNLGVTMTLWADKQDLGIYDFSTYLAEELDEWANPQPTNA